MDETPVRTTQGSWRGVRCPPEEERDVLCFHPAGERNGKNFEHPGPPARGSGWRAARGRADRLELLPQKSEKGHVVDDRPASRVGIIHGEL